MKCGGVISNLWITTSFPGFDCKSVQSLHLEDLNQVYFVPYYFNYLIARRIISILLLNNISTFRNVSGLGNKKMNFNGEVKKCFFPKGLCTINFHKIKYVSLVFLQSVNVRTCSYCWTTTTKPPLLMCTYNP